MFQQITQIDNDLKTKATAYNNLKNSLASIDRKATLVLIFIFWFIFYFNQELNVKSGGELWLAHDNRVQVSIYLEHSTFRGSLITKDLSDIVKADDFVLNSEYLQTLMVVVPK